MREFIDFNPKYFILKGNLEITGSESSSSADVWSELNPQYPVREY
jgi:hypothetical protein